MTHRNRAERGLHELYRDDSEAADARVWGRQSDLVTRRGFLRDAGLAAMGAALGMQIPLARQMPAGLIPVALADSTEAFRIPGKHDGLVVLNERPLNAETPPHLLDDPITAADRLFVRNNGVPPARSSGKDWTLEIGGESVERPMSFSWTAAATDARSFGPAPGETSGRPARSAARNGPACRSATYSKPAASREMPCTWGITGPTRT